MWGTEWSEKLDSIFLLPLTKKIKISGDSYSEWMCRCLKSRKKILFSRKKEDDRKGIRCDYFIIQNLHTKL